MLQVLVDADNVPARRLQPVLDVLAELSRPGDAGTSRGPDKGAVRMVASGRQSALERLTWPEGARLLPHEGWQRADVALAQAYEPSTDPLILTSGDGDFVLLAARHPGPVLVISGAPSGRLKDHATVVDPAAVGVEPVRQWLEAVLT